MMNLRSFAVRAAAGLLLVTSAAGKAQDAADVCGDIFQVQGDASKAYVVRRDGQRLRAEPYVQLFMGDRVIAGQGVRILIRGIKPRPVSVTAKDGPFVIQESGLSLASGARQWLQRLAAFFSARPRSLIVHNLPRDETAPPLARPEFLSEQRQFVPIGLARLTLVWRDGAGSATLLDSVRGEFRKPPSSFARATFTGPHSAPARAYFGKRDTESSGWNLVPADPATIPLPLWSQTQPATDRDRALRAIWLVTEGPAEWRLFAVSELELLKESDPFAGRFWHLLGSGQWPDAP